MITETLFMPILGVYIRLRYLTSVFKAQSLKQKKKNL